MVLMPLSLSASMTRWKPSVSSCSVPGASDFAAVFSMGIISLIVFRFGRIDRLCVKLRKQFLTVCLDIGSKAERMVACALLSEFGVAGFQRLDDRQMLGQGSRGA